MGSRWSICVQRYREEEANGPTFRGRLLVGPNLRENLVRADRFYVQFVHYDQDLLVNRLLRDALDALAGSGLSPLVAARAAAGRAAFPELGTQPVTSETFDRLHHGRSTARYQDALLLARMILERNAPQLRHGRVPVFALLFDMNVLWERYVAMLFRRAAPPELQVGAQESRPFWRAPDRTWRRVRPDLVVRRDGGALLVADTKWKVPGDRGPTSGDLDQMFVYNELYGAARALLVYPAVTAADADRVEDHGRFHDRPHTCELVHLGLFDGDRLRRDAIRTQIAALLARAAAGSAAGTTANEQSP